MGFSVLIGLFAGQYLDTRFGTEPWLLMVGLFFGATAGFLSLYRLLRSAMVDQQEDLGEDDRKDE